MQNQICVGALGIDNRQSLRLLQSGGRNQPVTTDYRVGQIWNVEFTARPDLTPPHVEDVIVSSAQLVRDARNIRDNLLRHVTPWRDAPSNMFDGFLRFTANGRGYVSERIGIPVMSTGYWLSDRDLERADRDHQVRYSYSTDDPIRGLTYVGTDEPIAHVPAGTLLRVSLARWWQPPGVSETRCYLQLSGWFL
jgi:hypothetical protein